MNREHSYICSEQALFPVRHHHHHHMNDDCDYGDGLALNSSSHLQRVHSWIGEMMLHCTCNLESYPDLSGSVGYMFGCSGGGGDDDGVYDDADDRFDWLAKR